MVGISLPHWRMSISRPENGPRTVCAYKGHGSPAASAFDGKNSAGETLEEILLDSGISDIHVVGVATDVCVKATAQAGNDLDFKTTIIWDLTASVQEPIQETCLALSAEGILSRSSDDLRAALGQRTAYTECPQCMRFHDPKEHDATEVSA
jgi:hypothetical protein